MSMENYPKKISLPSRKRAYKPKSRGGCITCKARRVKCDEEKPGCRRCKAWGAECEGYRANSSAPPKRELLPRISNPVSPVIDLSIHFESNTALESRYLELFEKHIASWLDAPVPNSLWGTVMLQGSRQVSFIKHALVAIAALFPLEGQNNPSLKKGQFSEFSLMYYAKALEEMRKSLSASWDSTRNALLGCLLISCYENISGNYVDALTHVKGGHRLVQDWIKHQPQPPARRDRIASPAPNVIEDCILRAFFRLDAQILTVFDTRPPGIHAELKDEAISSIETMPDVFCDMADAQQYLTLLEARSGHLLYEFEFSKGRPNAETSHVLDESEIYRGSQPDHDPSVFTRLSSGHWLTIPCPPTPQNNLDVEGSFLLDRWDQPFQPLYRQNLEEQLRHFDKWGEAFQPLCQQYWNSEIAMRVSAWILSINGTKGRMSITKALSPRSSSDNDPLLEGYKDIIANCKLIVDLLNQLNEGKLYPEAPYMNDVGVVPSLHIVARFCRDRAIRREAIALLRRVYWRERFWCCHMCADLDEYIMEVEEDGVETYDIPEEAMIRSITMPKFQIQVSSIYCTRGPGFSSKRVDFKAGRKVDIAIVLAFYGLSIQSTFVSEPPVGLDYAPM